MNNVNKKYQVFVSSTYVDLVPERQEIMNALLELDCIPAGMELFPAADEDQWSLIKGVIDECDYYIVVIGGRYGSLGSEGLSYTEMEYRYAIETEKPVIAFLHKEPDSIPAKFVEQTEEGKKKLKDFRELSQQKVCKYWSTPSELGSVVSRSLIMLQKKHPGIGWVRGDQVASAEASSEILRLRRRIEELESEVALSQTDAPKGTEALAQGDDKFTVHCEFTSREVETYKEFSWNWEIDASWNEIFYELSPLMMHEASNLQLSGRFGEFIRRKINEEVPESSEFEGHSNIRGISHDKSDFETAIVQLNALGLIVQNVKNRSVKDRGTYWTLTPYGQAVLNRLRAIRKPDL
ncbi:TPA: DUF4062 domain-containing protein [Vibrio cholerae]|nr:DUF4062 domain-containing protein [Vibrio cholerae]